MILEEHVHLTYEELLAFCKRAAAFDAVAIDTEVLASARTIRLCLVQTTATPEECVVIDPIVIKDLSPLAELMGDEGSLKCSMPVRRIWSSLSYVRRSSCSHL